MCFRNLDSVCDGEDNEFDAILSETKKQVSIGDMIKELGYGCTVDLSQCKQILSLVSPLDESAVARLLGSIVQTFGGTEDYQDVFPTFSMALGLRSSSLIRPMSSSWNVSILVESIKQLVGSFSERYFITFPSYCIKGCIFLT